MLIARLGHGFALPPKVTNRIEFAHAQSATVVSCFGPWSRQGTNNWFTLSFVNSSGFEVAVKQNEEHCVDLFFDVDGTHSLTGLAAFRHTPTLDLKSSDFPVVAFSCIISRLPGGRKLDLKNSSSFVLRNLARYSQRLACESTVLLSKLQPTGYWAERK